MRITVRNAVYKISYSLFPIYRFRTNQSQFYFATGLFDRRVALSDVRYEPAVDPHDPIIRFYKVCKKWQKEVKKNPESLKEQRLFEQSEKVLLHNIN